MPSIFEINEDQVRSLNDNDLTRILQRLLRSEAIRYKIPLRAITLSTEINAPDGGEDGRIKWEGEPSGTDWIPNNFTSFQIKATVMGPADCAKEVLNSMKSDLKPKIKEVFEQGGQYILFKNKNSLNKSQIDERILEIRKTLKDLGKDYADSARIDIYDINKITSWVNSYPVIVSYIKTEILGIDLSAFYSWEAWHRSVKDSFSTKFITNRGIEAIQTQIRDMVSIPGGKQRLIGLPGLGKTRIVFEVFNSSPAIQNLVVYANTHDFSEDNIMNGIRELIRNQAECILIVDNCSLLFHRKIINFIKGGGIRLLTINYDMSNLSEEGDSIPLNPDSFKEIIPTMLQELFSEISESDAKKISEFSMGFPLIAELLAKDKRGGSRTLGRLNDNQLVDRLIGVADNDDKEKRFVLMACSIFDKFGYDEEFIKQRLAISKNSLITRLGYSEEIAVQRFYEYCQKYIEIGILEKAGRFVFVKPKPLALRLAEDWWKYCPPEKVQEILIYLEINGLSEALCDQIAKLDFLPKAQEITAELCGESGPFGNAEVLNTKQGSRLFRSLVEVNPQVTSEALYRIYSEQPLSELRKVVKGRRNLIWALEKLCFWNNTFERASKVLLSFAAAENEEMISNNATGQFLQLFQIHLPGTLASLIQRQNLIDFALSKEEFLQIGISALARSLQTDHFSRMGGVEAQGSRSTVLYFLPTFNEGRDYWSSSVSKLEKILIEDSINRLRAKEILLQKLSWLVRNRCFDLISGAMYKILDVLPESRLEVYRATEKALIFGGKYISEEEKEELAKLSDLAKPNTFLERYKSFIATPDYNYTSLKSFDEYVTQKATEMAQEFVESGFKWEDYCENFLRQDQQGGFIFGKQIGILIKELPGSVLDIVNESLKTLEIVSRQERNVNVLKGVISSIEDPNLRNRIIESIFNDPEISYLTIEILSSIKPTIDELFQLFTLVDNGVISIENLAHFKYGRALYHLSSGAVIRFCKKIYTYNIEGIWTSLSIIFMYCYRDDEKYAACESFIKGILFNEGLILIETKIDAMDMNYWESFSQKILLNGDIDYANHISKEIVKYAISIDKRNIDTEIKSIIIILVDRYFDTFWRHISEVIISDEFDFFKLQYLLGSRIGSPGEEIGIIFKGNLETILNWCRGNIPIAPKRIVRLAPIFNESHGRVTWNDFTRTLIDEFGDIEGFMGDLDSNFSTFTWIGSLVPLIEKRICLVKELLEHKSETVKKWAMYKLDKLYKELKYENFEDSERFLNI